MAKAPKPTYTRECKLVQVTDGDTLILRLDLGYYTEITIKTRLRGINAPEVSTPEGKVVRDYVRKLWPVGTPLVVETFRDPEDKYGRWLARVFQGALCLNDHLIEKKMAVPFMVDG